MQSVWKAPSFRERRKNLVLMNCERTAHVLVEGLVQGVGFRVWAERVAARHALTGWVRNRRTGGVEMIVAGRSEAVSAAIEAARLGPSHARVDALYIIADVADAGLGVFDGFEVRPTV